MDYGLAYLSDISGQGEQMKGMEEVVTSQADETTSASNRDHAYGTKHLPNVDVKVNYCANLGMPTMVTMSRSALRTSSATRLTSPSVTALIL